MSIQQPALDFTASPPTLGDLLLGDSRCARLARYFCERRGQWIDGRQLEPIAGVYAWRTRVSDLRKRPWFLTIENRQRKEGHVTISEYRLVA